MSIREKMYFYEYFIIKIIPCCVLLYIISIYGFPDWILNSTVYRVNYSKGKEAKKIYKIQIKKDDDKMNLKIDCEGVILRSSD